MNAGAPSGPAGMPAVRRRLQWRLLLLAGAGMAAILTAFGVSSYLAVDESVDRALAERANLAAATASHVDYVLRESLKRLDEVSFADGISAGDAGKPAASEALRRAYFGSIFSGVYLADGRGTIVAMEPASSATGETSVSTQPDLRAALREEKPTVSGYSAGVTSDGPAVSVVVPLRDQSGHLLGVVGGDIGLRNGQLGGIALGGGGGSSYIQIVDSGGTILASTRPQEALEKSDHAEELGAMIQAGKPLSGTCHSCHAAEEASDFPQQREIMAFAPLKSAPWAILVREPESDALAFATQLRERAIWLGAPAFALALLVAWVTARSVVRPVSALHAAAERVASGDLSQPVPPMGKDEIGGLALAFETMRIRLKSAIETIEGWASELEGRVKERTQELEDSRDHLRTVAEENAALYEEVKRKEAARTELLGRVMSAQEEERRRIARELHDETSQALTVLAMGLETAAQHARAAEDAGSVRLSELKDLAVSTIDEVHRLIYDLRPSVLDDLGLVPGLRWYAEARLNPLGVRVSLITAGEERRLPPEFETALFRIGQEAIANAAQHASPSNLFIEVNFEIGHLVLRVDDDGEGFDLRELEGAEPQGRGWGLLGMRERAALIGGTIEIASAPGEGTRVRVEVPLPERGDE